MKKLKELWSRFRERSMSRMDNVENSFNFPVSRIFWHILNVLGVIGGIVGLVLVLYGLTPVFKKSVDKPELAQRQEVDISKLPKCTVKKTTSKNQVLEESIAEESCAMPKISLKELQKAFPKEKFTQILKKPQNICDASEAEETRVWNDYYEEWEVKKKFPERCFVSGEVDTRFSLELRKKINAYFPCDSEHQQLVADSMAIHLLNYQEKERNSLMKISFHWLDRQNTLEAVNAVFDLWNDIDRILGNAEDASITENVVAMFNQFDDFMEKNPENGYEMVKKALEVINIAHGTKRLDVWMVSRKSYGDIIKIYKTYDADGQLQMTPISDWIRATDQFLSMSNLHSGNEIDCNLKNYYALYIDMMKLQVEENAKRVSKYNAEVAAADAEASVKKMGKLALMGIGGWAILAGFATIVILALILLLFNIQRTLLSMKELMTKDKGPDGNISAVPENKETDMEP